MKIHIRNVRSHDTSNSECNNALLLFSRVKYFLNVNWYELINDFSDADMVLLNTCWVLETCENEYLSDIKEIRKISPNVKIWVYWCLAFKWWKIEEQVDFIIPLKQEFLFDDYFKHKVSILDISRYESGKTIDIYNDKTYFVEISRGCIHNCTYCWIKKAIWHVKTKNIDEIINEIKEALNDWFKFIYLISDDVCSWGQDIWLDFSYLFNEIVKLWDDFYINLWFTEPSEFIKIFPKIKENFFRVAFMIYPIQSYNDRILDLMWRKYKVSEYNSSVDEIKKYSSKRLIISNNIICCYPTETFEEFKNNLFWALNIDSNTYLVFSQIPWKKVFKNFEYLTSFEIEKRKNVLRKLNEKDSEKYILYF